VIGEKKKMATKKQIKNFVKQRNKALLSLDEKTILKFMRKYKINTPLNDSNKLVFWAGVHKAILNIESATEEQKIDSRLWLSENGFDPA
jgi:hypothetical protein